MAAGPRVAEVRYANGTHVHGNAPYNQELVAGMTDGGKGFQKNCLLYKLDHPQSKSGLTPNFFIDCTPCCWQYLTGQRQYKTFNGNFDRVTFGEGQYVTGNIQDGRNYTSCFLNKTTRHKVGQFQTGQLYNNNFRIVKNKRSRASNKEPAPKAVVSNHHTYRYYIQGEDPLLPDDRVSMGVVLSTSLESVGVNVLQNDEISGTSLNYCDAALLELYREAVGKDTLQGTCETRPRLANGRQGQNQDDDIDDDIGDEIEEQNDDSGQNNEQSDEEETDEEESSEK